MTERLVDLHMHSTASDGALPPAEVVAAAQRAGLEAIALTDHDTVAGVDEARAAGERLGVRVVPGIELSAVEPTGETHVLGLHLANTDEVAHALDQLRRQRIVRAERIVERLNALGIPVTTEAVRGEAGEGAVGRPHVARALVAGGWVRDHREAFNRYLGYGRPGFVAKEMLSLSDAIALIHRAGGIALLAHPGSGGTRAHVERAVGLGLDGLEVRHPGHSVEDVARLGALVEHFGLVPTGGSDWHGASEGPRALGSQRVPYAWLERQEQRVRRRAAGGSA